MGTGEGLASASFGTRCLYFRRPVSPVNISMPPSFLGLLQFAGVEADASRARRSLSHLRHLASAVLGIPALVDALAPDLRQDLAVRCAVAQSRSCAGMLVWACAPITCSPLTVCAPPRLLCPSGGHRGQGGRPTGPHQQRGDTCSQPLPARVPLRLPPAGTVHGVVALCTARVPPLLHCSVRTSRVLWSGPFPRVWCFVRSPA